MTSHRTLDRLIDEQVHSWSLQQRAGGAAGAPFGPVITVSRSFGARGAELARLLGDRTGFTVWDRELVQAIADESGGDERIMESLDERRRAAIDDAIRSLLSGVDHTNVQYFASLMRVLRTIAHHGSAIILGRGANFVLRKEVAFRIRVTAPLDWRVAGVAERTGQTRSKARTAVVSRDGERADFVYHYFRQDVDDSEHYDLVMNASRLGVEQMADLALQGYHSVFGNRLASGRTAQHV